MLLTIQTRDDIFAIESGETYSYNIGNTLDMMVSQILYIRKIFDNDKLKNICIAIGNRNLFITDEDQNTLYQIHHFLKKAIRNKKDYLTINIDGSMEIGQYNLN